MIGSAAALIAALAALVAAVHAYLNPSRRPAHRFIFLLRVATIVGLTLAFLQPALQVKRLVPSDPRVPVLIDVSESMGLFSPDSTVIQPLAKALGSYAGKARQRYPVYWFGDSLRHRAHTMSPGFTDRRSFLPRISEHPVLSDARRVLILSDGNFSNPVLPVPSRTGPVAYYVRMPGFVPRSCLSANAVDVPPFVLQDSRSSADVEVRGFLPVSGPLVISVTENNNTVYTSSAAADSGWIRTTLAVPLPTAKAGRRAYAIAVEGPDSLRTVCHAVWNVIPGRFRIGVDAQRPTLDKRFLSLAMARRPGWSVLGDTTHDTRADALFLFGWEEERNRILGALRPGCPIVFIGRAPARECVALHPQSLTPATSSLIRELPGLPPPATVFSYGGPAFSKREVALWTHLTYDKRNPALPDSLPLIVVGRYRGHPAIIVAAEGIWRWDFWPLFSEKATTLPFSHHLLSLVEKEIIASLAADFFAFPARSQPSEIDSLRMRMIVPSADVEASATVTIRIDRRKGRTIVDTAVVLPSAGGTERLVSLPPIPAGDYTYRCSWGAGKSNPSYSGSFTVAQDRSEFEVRGQNTLILDQIARPVSHDSAALSTVLSLSPEELQPRIATTLLRPERTFTLLAILILLLGTEWFLRKRNELD